MSIAYRPGPDGRRAPAGGGALLFVANNPGLAGGYIGVDIFFVISGYLITSILYRDISDGTFSLIDFYDRRIRRIFPALFVMLPIVTVLAAFFLTPRQMTEFAQSLIPSALFYANIHFYNLLNYFGPQAHDTALLHLWSLAVEEQYYIFFPLLFFACLKIQGRMLSIVAFVVIAVASFIWTQSVVRNDPMGAFFLLQGRAWELLVGAVLALVKMPRLSPRAATIIGTVGLAAIVIPVFTYDRHTIFPGLAAMPIVFGTAAVTYAGTQVPNAFANRILAVPGMVYVGRISYALYLWHWPLLVFGALYKGRPLTYLQGSGLLIVAFILAALSLKYVETPLRHGGAMGGVRRSRFIVGGAAIAATLLVGFGIERIGRGVWPISPRGAAAEMAASDRSPFQLACNNPPHQWTNPLFKAIHGCAVGPKAASDSYDVLIWGDSHAGASFLGLAQAVKDLGMTARLQTMSGCPPLIGGIANSGMFDGVPCAEFNAAVLDEIAKVKPRLVIMVGRWSMWTTRAGGDFVLTTTELPGGDVESQDNSRRIFAHMLDRTLKKLDALGPRVLLMGQVPEYAGAPAKCVVRQEFYHEKGKDCLQLGVKQAMAVIGEGNRMIDHAAAPYQQMQTYLLSGIFCQGDVCRAGDGERYFYSDHNHLSATGSRMLREDQGLKALLASVLDGKPRNADLGAQ